VSPDVALLYRVRTTQALSDPWTTAEIFKNFPKFKRVTPIEGAKWERLEDFGDFQSISLCVSEMVQERATNTNRKLTSAFNCYQNQRLWMSLNGRRPHARMMRLSELTTEPSELKPILLRGVIKCFISFPVTVKCLTLNDLDMPFDVEICFHRRFNQIFFASLSETTMGKRMKILSSCQQQNVRQPPVSGV